MGELVMSHRPIDSVERAQSTPEVTLPYRELGVTDDEYQEIVSLLGRGPPLVNSRCIRDVVRALLV
jgi:hypothetical protein